MGKRVLSYSEVSAAMTCQARWAFAYGGQLSDGDALTPRRIAPILSSGSAWGAGAAAWHSYPHVENLLEPWNEGRAKIEAHHALRQSLEQDVQREHENGFPVPTQIQMSQEEVLLASLDHYMATAQRLPNLTRLEEEFTSLIPSRAGQRGSTRYSFLSKIDGYTVDDRGAWVVEFKWRTQLTPVQLIQMSQQVRYYCWSLNKTIPVRGVLVDERLSDAPKPPRIVQGKKKGTFRPSHAVDQLTTPDWYVAVCKEFDEDPHPDTVAALEAREWQKRTPIIFRRGELEQAGRELTSAAKFIRDLDSGELYPVRNTVPFICKGCKFLKICPNPEDRVFVDSLYVRKPPKRFRGVNVETSKGGDDDQETKLPVDLLIGAPSA